jgi:hypothetical protein
MVPSVAAADQHRVTSIAATGTVLIVVVDPITGDRHAEVECEAPASSFASKIVVDGDAWDLSAVTRICTDPSAIGSLASS